MIAQWKVGQDMVALSVKDDLVMDQKGLGLLQVVQEDMEEMVVQEDLMVLMVGMVLTEVEAEVDLDRMDIMLEQQVVELEFMDNDLTE